MGKLLREYVSFDYDKNIIKEAKEKGTPIRVKALLQKSDELNQNKRRYPHDILVREVKNYEKAVAENRATGELDHPDSSVVELKNVSHMVKEIWWEGNNVMGIIEVLNTPSGRIAQDLMESGVMLGISSRGVGDTIKNEVGEDVVDESFMLVAFDLVSEPSTHGAWLMGENKDVTISDIRKMVPKVDRINRIVNEILKGS